MASLDYAQRAAAIVRDAGGSIVGRTRLQKIAFFLEAVGLGLGFPFRYKHYGPYSELLANAAQHASATNLMHEREGVAAWGGSYSIFTSNIAPDPTPNYMRQHFAHQMVTADAVELELAATALYLKYEGYLEPWYETARRKPDKAAAGRLEKAQHLYERLRKLQTPNSLPTL